MGFSSMDRMLEITEDLGSSEASNEAPKHRER